MPEPFSDRLLVVAEALLANTAAFYALYHGPDGLKKIASNVHAHACVLAKGLDSLGYEVDTTCGFFDTVKVGTDNADEICAAAVEAGMNFRKMADGVCLSVDETTEGADLHAVLNVFAACAGKVCPEVEVLAADIQVGTVGGASLNAHSAHKRMSDFLTHSNFNSYQTETEMLRYMNQ